MVRGIPCNGAYKRLGIFHCNMGLEMSGEDSLGQNWGGFWPMLICWLYDLAGGFHPDPLLLGQYFSLSALSLVLLPIKMRVDIYKHV